jgi:sterol desaturase/sphingolipid hydroxylase (fatty acid hydroxylase superfamily)
MPVFLVSFAVLTAMFLVVAALERVPRLQHTPSRFHRTWFETDLLWYLVAAFAAGLSGFILRRVLDNVVLPGVSAAVDALPGPVALVAAVIVFDGLFFTVHVALHRSDTLWRVHKVHHSSRQLDFLATTRTHAFEHLVRNLPAQLVLIALGFPPVVIGTAVLVIGGFGVLNHSNLRLPLDRLEWLFITPRLHRAHHVPATTQTNFATILTLWDRAGRSLSRVDTPADAVLGVPGEVDTFPQPFRAAFTEPPRQIRLARRSASARA